MLTQIATLRQIKHFYCRFWQLLYNWLKLVKLKKNEIRSMRLSNSIWLNASTTSMIIFYQFNLLHKDRRLKIYTFFFTQGNGLAHDCKRNYSRLKFLNFKYEVMKLLINDHWILIGWRCNKLWRKEDRKHFLKISQNLLNKKKKVNKYFSDFTYKSFFVVYLNFHFNKFRSESILIV